MGANRPNCLVLNPRDNVAVSLDVLAPGDRVGLTNIVAAAGIPAGHKIAVAPIEAGRPVVKYGQLIGFASRSIAPGEHVHVDNVSLGPHSHDYRPGINARPPVLLPPEQRRSFDGYQRSDGRVGTRNAVGVIATVSCSGDVSHFIADAAARRLLPEYPGIDGVVALSHSGGCCQAPGSEGLDILQRTIAGYARNPNFGGILLVGLGCEVNLVETLLEVSGLQPETTFHTLTIQQAGGTEATIEAGVKAIAEMLPVVGEASRQSLSAEHLVVGLECGGSDAYSGITANPALGEAIDLLVLNGGTAILSETPEIYGAEHQLIERAISPEVGERLAERIRWWEEYTGKHGVQINNNPTPGNKAGGISTIFEKSLGAAAKAGSTNLNEVYGYAEQVTEKGLVFMDTPGYDVVSITGMIAGGANMICFTTGRGTVCGFRPVPTLKLATNSGMYRHLKKDMDINCGTILEGESDIATTGRLIFERILATASGKKTRSEQLGFGTTEFVPWQMGAVL